VEEHFSWVPQWLLLPQ